MEPSCRSIAQPTCSHHHHPICRHHHHPICRHHRHPHVHGCPIHGHHHHNLFHHPLALPNPRGLSPYPHQTHVHYSEEAKPSTIADFSAQVLEEGDGLLVENEEQEMEEEEDPVLVLTDEWREFFAKSAAKRKLEKQQTKRKEK